jgi:hypothetical protein
MRYSFLWKPLTTRKVNGTKFEITHGGILYYSWLIINLPKFTCMNAVKILVKQNPLNFHTMHPKKFMSFIFYLNYIHLTCWFIFSRCILCSSFICACIQFFSSLICTHNFSWLLENTNWNPCNQLNYWINLTTTKWVFWDTRILKFLLGFNFEISF